jgi:glycosyltransferase involved in cell wall biosynthesis
MRILALENELTSMRGGQEISLLDVCGGLAGKGHQITLAYVTPGDLENDYRRICHRMVPLRTYSIDRSRTVASLRDFLVSLWAVRGGRPDVVYANQYQDSLLAGIARRLHRTPFVCHLRLPPPDVMCTQFRLGMSQATRLVAISEQTKRDWAACGYPSQAIDVVHNGIDLGRYVRRAGRPELRRALGVPADELLVTYAGRLHPAKGVETLLEGFSLIAHKRPSHLVLAGRAAAMPGSAGGMRDYLGELRNLAERLGIARAITWIEHQRDMAGLFSASDVTILPSLWSEPFGRVVIESMACETPVVASRVGGISEILTGEFAEWMVTAGQPGELASRVLAITGQPGADPGIGQRARAHVASRFSVDRMVDGVEHVLLGAVERFRMPSPMGAVASRMH